MTTNSDKNRDKLTEMFFDNISQLTDRNLKCVLAVANQLLESQEKTSGTRDEDSTSVTS